MMTILNKKMAGGLLAAAGVLWLGSPDAAAQDYTPPPDPYAPAPEPEPDVPPTVYGIALSVGGGVANFTSSEMRANTDLAGVWDVRALIGSRSPIALEAAYVGSAQAIDARFGEENTATLIGTGLEGNVRVNLIPFEMLTPYAFAGLGYKRYDVSGADFRTADTGIADNDTLLEVPLGAGLAYRARGFLADARFTYRMAMGEDLVIPGDFEGDRDAAGLDTWGVTARLGVEF
jgi:opacity protein-like surface antigen